MPVARSGGTGLANLRWKSGVRFLRITRQDANHGAVRRDGNEVGMPS